MNPDQSDKLRSVRLYPCTSEAEPDVLRLLQTAFGRDWGDSAFWRWKHRGRPGFSASDVGIYTSGETIIGCWHMTSCSLRLAPGLEVFSCFEGDYALQSDWRGVGIGREHATMEVVRMMAQRGVIVRFAFTSQALYERVYQNRLGYHRVPTVTLKYRKLLSDRAIRGKLQAAGARALQSVLVQRLVRSRPLVIHLDVGAFSPCSLVIERSTVECLPGRLSDPDLIARIPYAVLTIRRGRPILGLLVVVRTLLTGQVRVRGLAKFAFRCLSSVRT
jgi:hypothetical protein